MCVEEMAAGWTSEETKALIGIWGKEEVQNALDGIVRNKTSYQKVASAMAGLGYVKTWQQCRMKVKNRVQKYKKIKDSNNISGCDRSSCPFFNELDAILGTRASSMPPALLDSGGEAAVDISVLAQAENNENDHDQHTPVLEEDSIAGNSSSSPGYSEDQEDDNFDDTIIPNGTTTASTSTTTASTTTASTTLSRRDAITMRKRGLVNGNGNKRKHSDSDVLEMYILLCNQADEKAAEKEERMRLKELEMEERRIEKENRHEERMLSMMLAVMQQTGHNSLPHFRSPDDRTSPYSSLLGYPNNHY